jgi:hypothetical protein
MKKNCNCDLLCISFFSFCPLESVKCSNEVGYMNFYCAPMLSMAAIHLSTLFWTLMAIFDFRHVPKFLPLHITMKCTCLSIYLPCHIYMHVSTHMERAWYKTLGMLFYWGRVELGFELRVLYLLGRCSYHLRQSSSPCFLINVLR